MINIAKIRKKAKETSSKKKNVQKKSKKRSAQKQTAQKKEQNVKKKSSTPKKDEKLHQEIDTKKLDVEINSQKEYKHFDEKETRTEKQLPEQKPVEETIAPEPIPKESFPEFQDVYAQRLLPQEIMARLLSVPRVSDRFAVQTKTGEWFFTQEQMREGRESLLLFQLAGEWYALPLSVIREIVRIRPITRIPGAPDDVLGVMNLRGNIIIVIDSYKRLGLPEPAQFSKRHRVVVVEQDGELVGFVVEHKNRVAYIRDMASESPPLHIPKEKALYIQRLFLYEEQVVSYLALQQFLQLGVEHEVPILTHERT